MPIEEPMRHAAAVLEGIDLAWWPTMLRSLAEDDKDGLSETFNAQLSELAAIVRSEDADALEELTLP